MAKKSQDEEAGFNDSSSFSPREYFAECLAKWKWFVISVLVFVCIGMLFVLRTPPLYKRTMSVLIKDQQQGGGFDIEGAFSQFGFGVPNTNVNNELISLTSPAVISEVVRRLQLNVGMTRKGTWHGDALFGDNNPIELEYPGLDDHTEFMFRMKLLPGGSYTLYKFVCIDANGKKIKYDKEVSGRLGTSPVNTPVGKLYLRNNPAFSGRLDDENVIYIGVTSYAAATEHYLSRISGDLADVDADVIDLTIEDTNTQRAADILNTTVDVYNEYWIQDKNKVNIATSKFISERLEKLSGELGDIDRDIADYKSSNKMLYLGEAARAFTDQAADVDANLLQVSNQLAMAKYVREFIAAPANRLSIIPVTTGLGPSSLENSIAEYNQILLNRENLVRNSGTGNPLVRDYDTQLNGLRETIMRSLASQIGTLETSVRTMSGARQNTDEKLADLPKQSQQLVAVTREQTVMESLYIFLLQKREESDLQQAFTASNTRIITPPYGRRAPVAPQKGMILAMCFMLGLFMPAALIYMLVVSNDKVNSRHDLENLPVPFAGEIPQVGGQHKIRRMFLTKKQRQKEIDRPKPIVAEGKRDVPNEAFRVVRSNIDLMLHGDADDKVITVTSFNPGSGKSFVAFNLGASFALKRKKVLLVDGDLRHGSMSTYVSSPHRGLSSYLQGHTDDVSSLVKRVDGFDSLYVMPIGHKPPNPAELLEDGRFRQFIDTVRAEYDLILIDCPPVNVVVDTQIIDRYTDRTLFVVRAGLLKKSAVRDIVTLYKEKKLKKISVLLNGTEEGQSSYYTYGNYSNHVD